METILNIVRKIRAMYTHLVLPRERYLSLNTVKPASTKYGFDRGKPTDRFYIEKFMEEHSDFIKGRCLEIVDNTYTVRYGGNKVQISDALDIFKTPKANIHGDLRNLHNVESNLYDCLIVTQTLNVVDRYEDAIKECYRILKPGGVLLVTMPTLSPTWNLKINLWRFTPESSQYVFGKHFGEKNVEVKSYGNKLTSEFFWIGFAVEDLELDEFNSFDKNWPTIIGIVARK